MSDTPIEVKQEVQATPAPAVAASASGGYAQLEAGLDILSGYIVPDYKEALDTLLVYTKNLIDYPEEKKYRKVKLSNIHFQERLGRLNGASEAMNAIGFVAVGDYLRFDEESISESRMTLLRQMRELITTRREAVRKAFEILPVRLPETHKYTSVAAAAAHGEIGRRADMEDDDLIIDQFGGIASQGYFALYDGHGGRQTVDFVVKTLHLNLEQELNKTPSPSLSAAYTAAYLATDGQLRRQNILRSGTTSVTCLIRVEEGRRILYTANVGDSRAVLCRQEEAIRLTIDHKATAPEEAKRVKDAGGYIGRNQRVNGVLAISRALGDHMLKENNVVSAEPYCVTTVLEESDRFLLLACDGVWDVMTDQEAIDFVLEQYPLEKEQAEKAGAVDENAILKRIAKGLIQNALHRRSLDNISVVLIKL